MPLFYTKKDKIYLETHSRLKEYNICLLMYVEFYTCRFYLNRKCQNGKHLQEIEIEIEIEHHFSFWQLMDWIKCDTKQMLTFYTFKLKDKVPQRAGS